MLATYCDSRGSLREVLTRPGSGGSLLVIDRDAATRGDRRLVAHLAADEPPANAALTCGDYLRQVRMHDARSRLCRPLTAEDLRVVPPGQACGEGWLDPLDEEGLRDGHGHVYRLRPFAHGDALQLRWQRSSKQGDAPLALSLRQVVAAFESYQPAREITVRALARPHQGAREDARLSRASLRHELERMEASPLVLNRALREAVHCALAGGLSMSEIAVRCGRLKRCARGGIYGDTSWLARRVGISPAPGHSEPTPWVHSDVLALIARSGLGISPREVELG